MLSFNLILEDLVYHLLVRSLYIFKPEGYDSIVIYASIDDKENVFPIF